MASPPKDGDNNQRANTIGKLFGDSPINAATGDYYKRLKAWREGLKDKTKDQLDEELDDLLDVLGNEEQAGPVSTAIRDRIEVIRNDAAAKGIELAQTERLLAYAQGNLSTITDALSMRRGRAPSAAVLKGKPGLKALRDKQKTLPGAKAQNNVHVSGSGEGGDCGIKPYKDQKCPKGQQAHHIVPDYTLRYGNRKDAASRIPGMPSQEDGPSVCLTGGSKKGGSEHNAAHEGTDPRISEAGKRTDNGPQGAAPIGDIIDISIEEVSKVKPHCAEEIKKKVDKAFEKVDRNTYGRTTQPLPKEGTEAQGAFKDGKAHKRGRSGRGF